MADVGRPTVMTPEVIAKLEEAFANGATDKEAIFIANISKDAFYDYQKANPEFADRKEALRDMVKYTARKNVVNKIKDGDIDQSNWYLERKAKDEFSSRTETDVTTKGESINKPVELTNEQFERIIRTRAEKLDSKEGITGGAN